MIFCNCKGPDDRKLHRGRRTEDLPRRGLRKVGYRPLPRLGKDRKTYLRYRGNALSKFEIRNDRLNSKFGMIN